MMKDSLARVMDLTLRYNPTRMIRMAIRDEKDSSSRCVVFWEHVIALILDVDMRLTLELFFGFRSHSHHCHHLPDESYMTKTVKDTIGSHHHHLSRSSWRIAHAEATPDVQNEQEDPHDIYPPGTLHWIGAMRRWKEHRELLEKHPVQNYTTLDPGLRAIQWCDREFNSEA